MIGKWNVNELIYDDTIYSDPPENFSGTEIFKDGEFVMEFTSERKLVTYIDGSKNVSNYVVTGDKVRIDGLIFAFSIKKRTKLYLKRDAEWEEQGYKVTSKAEIYLTRAK